MAWGSVTDIGTASGNGATIAVSPPVIPAGALIVLIIFDGGGAPLAGAVTDTKGSPYRRILTQGLSSVYCCTNCNALTGADSIIYTKQDAINFGMFNASYVTNSLGILYDDRASASALTAATNAPSITSNAPTVAGELFFGAIVTSATFTQDLANGWAAPPNDTGLVSGIDIAGGSKVNASSAAQTFAPTLGAAVVSAIYVFAFTTANPDWITRLSEPVRVRKFPVRENYFFRNPFIGPYRELLNDWYRPLSEPVRRKPPLGPYRQPFLFEIINHVQFTLAVTEAGDVIALSFATYTPKNMARVTITEIENYPSRVTIKEIVQGREYS